MSRPITNRAKRVALVEYRDQGQVCYVALLMDARMGLRGGGPLRTSYWLCKKHPGSFSREHTAVEGKAEKWRNEMRQLLSSLPPNRVLRTIGFAYAPAVSAAA